MWVGKRVLSIVAAIVVIALIIIVSCYSLIALTNGIDSGVVVIDAGHGGIDGGVSHGELCEKDITLDVSIRLKAKFEKKGYKVIMTREDDSALSDKTQDMQARKEIIEKAQPDITISIHVNKFTHAYRRGVQIFYDDTGRNREVGERMQSVMNTYINDRYAKRTDLKALGGDYYITKCTTYPSIIVECGFMSNPDDRALIQQDGYKDELCDAIIKGVVSMNTANA